MCGILGLVHYNKSAPTFMEAKIFRSAISSLFKQSQIRGADATGMLLLTDSNAALFKDHVTAEDFIGTSEYSNMLKSLNRYNSFRVMLGHVREKTKGHQRFNINNHPIVANRIIGVHNGIIGNDDFLFDKYVSHLDRKGEVDSEIIFRLLDMYRKRGKTLVSAVEHTCEDIVGSYACAFIDIENPNYVTLFSNKGNISIFVYENLKLIAFASSIFILRRALKNNSALDPSFTAHRIELNTNGIRIDTRTGKILEFDIAKKKLTSPQTTSHQSTGCSLIGTMSQRSWVCECDHLCNGCPYYIEP